MDISGSVDPRAAVTGMFSDQPPKAEGGIATPGEVPEIPRQDHQHPRLTSTANGTLNAQGEATITFTRVFATKPSVITLYVEAADGQPVVFKVKSWAQNGQGGYTGCVIKGYRSQTIPTNLVTLLLGGVFNLFNGSASGVEYTLVAVTPSAPA